MLKKVLMIIAATLVVLVGAAIGSFYYVDSKIFLSSKKGSQHNTINNVSALQSIINSVSNQKGTDNIILAGIDARSKETASRTDSIMMATVDRTNKAIKLTSFMRDMYVAIPGYSKKYKINTAYFLGGPDLLIDTLNQDFNTNAQYYVTIDFSAFQALVDKLNGVDIDVKPYEIKEMNKYIKEENWGNPDYVKTSGLQHLNGQQVLSYCRIRKVGNSDYERTERQRKVLSLLIEKARKESILNLPKLFNALLPYIKTNIPSSKLFAYGISAYKFSKSPVTTLRIPADGAYSNQVIGGQDVLVPDITQNTNLLSEFIASNNLPQDNTDNTGAHSTANNTKTDASNTSEISDKNSDASIPKGSSNTNEINGKGSIDVSILNSTGRSGLAAEYKTKLEKLGYNVTEVDNYPYRKYNTTVINDYSRQGYGNLIYHDLKFGNIIKKQKERPRASIVIILGSDSENN